MPLPKPNAVRFEISVRAKLPPSALALLRKEAITEAVEQWLEGAPPDHFDIRLTVWSHNKSRAIPEIGSDARGERLREVLRKALQSGALQIRQVGHTR
jgi:hypothetical protein